MLPVRPSGRLRRAGGQDFRHMGPLNQSTNYFRAKPYANCKARVVRSFQIDMSVEVEIFSWRLPQL